MKEVLVIIHFFVRMHIKFALGLVLALAAFWAFFWYGGLWTTINQGEEGYRSLQLNLGTVCVGCVLALAGYIAFCFRTGSSQNIFLQLPVRRESLYVAPFVLALIGSFTLYLLFEPAWRVGFLGFSVPTSYFLIFIPFVTMASVLRFKRFWIGMGVAIALAFLYYYLHFYWLNNWFVFQSQLYSEFLFLGLSLFVGFIAGGLKFARVAPLAAAIPFFMGAVTNARDAGNAMEAVELLAFHESPKWVEQFRKFSVSEESWGMVSQRPALYRYLVWRGAIVVEKYLSDEEKFILVKNLVRHSDAFVRKKKEDVDYEQDYTPEFPLSVNQISARTSEYLRNSGADENVICNLLPADQSWENLLWKVRSKKCNAYSLLHDFIPGTSDGRSVRTEKMFLHVFELANFSNAQTLVQIFYQARSGARDSIVTEEQFRTIASKSGVREEEWSRWKTKLWNERREQLSAVLVGSTSEISKRIAALPIQSKAECRSSHTILSDLCRRLGNKCRTNEELDEMESFGRFLNQMRTKHTACAYESNYIWHMRRILSEPKNLEQLEKWGRELREPASVVGLSAAES